MSIYSIKENLNEIKDMINICKMGLHEYDGRCRKECRKVAATAYRLANAAEIKAKKLKS